MKNKIAIASAFLAAASFSTAEIVVNDFLSFEGFVDMSYSHTETDAAGADNAQNSFQVDQVEISWLFDFDTVTAQIDLEYEDGSTGLGSGSDGDTEVEQAFVTYHFDNGGAITAGRYASMLGFEAFEPTGLYQWSTAYSFLGGLGTPLYVQGVKYTSESDTTFFGISLQDTGGLGYGSVDSLGGGDANGFGDGYGVEVAAAFTPGNGLTYFLGAAYDHNDRVGEGYAVNGYVSYETGAWIFAAELNYFDNGVDTASPATNAEGVSGLLMANFAYSDQGSVTGRVSFVDFDNGAAFGNDYEGQQYTLAHNWAFTDNLLLITEVTAAETDGVGASTTEQLAAAVELLFTF